MTPIFFASSACDFASCGRNSCKGGSRKRIVAGIPLKGFENSDEIFALIGQQLRQSRLPIGYVVRQDHLAHRVDAVALEKHVFGAGKPDPDRAKGERILGLFGRIGVAADIEARELGAPLHELVERLKLLRFLRGFVPFEGAGDDLARCGGDLPGIDRPRCAIDGKEVAFFKNLAAGA